MIEAGVFDVGGVLHTNEMQHVRADIQNALGISEATFRECWNQLSPGLGNGLITEEGFWRIFLNKAQADSARLPRTESLLLREYSRRFTPNTEVLDIVGELKARKCKLAILSNTIESHVAFLRGKGVFSNFDVTVFSNEAGMSKPNPQIYIITLERLNSDVLKTVFVDDNLENVEAALELGMIGIYFQSAGQLRNDLISLGAL